MEALTSGRLSIPQAPPHPTPSRPIPSRPISSHPIPSHPVPSQDYAPPRPIPGLRPARVPRRPLQLSSYESRRQAGGGADVAPPLCLAYGCCGGQALASGPTSRTQTQGSFLPESRENRLRARETGGGGPAGDLTGDLTPPRRMQIRAHRHRTPRPGSAREKRSRTYARDLSSISLGLSLPQVIHCMAYPKEVVVVPDDWWHATCNMMPYTLAVGGQTWDNAHLPPFQARSQESRRVQYVGKQLGQSLIREELASP